MTGYITKLSDNLSKGTDEINKINNIKDNRLKLSKAKKVVNRISQELIEFNNEINDELPAFSENLKETGKIISETLLTYQSFSEKDEHGIKSSVIYFRDSMEGAMHSTAGMLKEILKWPSINTNFNTSKRQTEIVLKDLTKEIMFGLTLIDEAIDNITN